VRSRNDTGQAAVEFALAVPIVLVLVLGVVQVLVVGARQVALEQLARNGARAASVAGDPSTAGGRAVTSSSRLDPLEVEVAAGADRVTVTVRYVDPTNVPLIGRVIGDVTLTASATMAREPP
jgi:Flp pilus assembly protein TadG